MRTMVAEDSASIAEALQFSLSQAGRAVDWVADGAAADSILKDDVLGLAIPDLGLPKLDGLEVLRRLRRRDPAMPVLILSGREKREEKVAGLDLGADDYLLKPFSLNDLQARGRALLRRGLGTVPLLLAYGSLTFDTIGRITTIDGCTLASGVSSCTSDHKRPRPTHTDRSSSLLEICR